MYTLVTYRCAESWNWGAGVKRDRRTHTSEKNTNNFPILVSLGHFATTDLGSQGELLPNSGLNSGRSGGDEISELIGCSNHEGPESWW
jgi:hypothetical protein